MEIGESQLVYDKGRLWFSRLHVKDRTHITEDSRPGEEVCLFVLDVVGTRRNAKRF